MGSPTAIFERRSSVGSGRSISIPSIADFHCSNSTAHCTRHFIRPSRPHFSGRLRVLLAGAREQCSAWHGASVVQGSRPIQGARERCREGGPSTAVSYEATFAYEGSFKERHTQQAVPVGDEWPGSSQMRSSRDGGRVSALGRRSASNPSAGSGYAKGFPEEVPMDSVPDQFRFELNEEDGAKTAAAVALGSGWHAVPVGRSPRIRMTAALSGIAPR